MIKADSGHVAVFKTAHGRHTEDILAWDDEGHALVLDKKGQLIRARSYNNFEQVEQAKDPYVTTVPGQGWLVEVTEPDGKTWSHPVIAFAFDKDGYGTVICGASDGSVEVEQSLDGETRKLIPPGGWQDSEETAG